MSIALKIDHVTIAGSDLARLKQTMTSLGLSTDYGGPHSNNITHMALLGFNDGSYIELISTMQAGQGDAIFWGEFIVANGGPCAWAVQVDDVAAEVGRIAGLGIPINGPTYYHRRRPNGKLVEWDLAILGDEGTGARLPFIIKDITPRAWRVHPSASVADGLLTGIAAVILGVTDLPASSKLFQRVYHWPRPSIMEDLAFGARLAHFAGTPVFLATPLAGDNWLAQRLARFGNAPCGYLIGADSFEAARKRYGLISAGEWFGHPVAWFDPARLSGFKLGVSGGVPS
jgi:catechol 2,3-dioxygenase-like lactoylglutathione lyase family enzyme